MSHSKYNKRGKSLYLDNWNPNAKKYINVVLCQDLVQVKMRFSPS